MSSRLRLLLAPLAVLALSLAFIAPAGAATRITGASSRAAGPSSSAHGWSIPANSASALNFSDPARDTHVHVFPDIPWFEQNVPGFRIGGGSGHANPTGFDAQTCLLGTNPNASFTFQGQNEDALAVTGFGAYTDSHGQNITGEIQVKSLSDGVNGDPTIAGSQDIWYVQWAYKGTTYFLSASYPGNGGNIDQSSGLPVDFSGGYVSTTPTGGSLYNGGVAATGSLDLKDGVIKITSSLPAMATAASGSAPAVGDALSSMQSETDYLVGGAGTGSLQPGTTLKSQTQSSFENGNASPDCPMLSNGSGGGSTAPAPQAGGATNLFHYGGPVAHHITNYLIFWLPQAGATTDGKSNCPIPGTANQFYEPGGQAGGDTNYEEILKNFFHDLAGTSYYNLLAQYADEHNGAITNDAAFGKVFFDPCGYTSTTTTNGQTTTVPGGTQSNPIYDVDMQNEVLKVMKDQGWPDGLGNEYFVFTGYNAASCFSPVDVNNPNVPGCSVQGAPPGYCAYHGDFIDPSGNPVLYANMADGDYAGGPNSTGLCYSSPINGSVTPAHTVNGQTVHDGYADVEVNITSHEMFETMSDAMVGTANNFQPPLGWYADPADANTADSADGEIGDKCAYIYGQYNPADDSNITLQNGDDYIVQQEYSDWANGCALGGGDGAVAYAGATDAVTINPGWNLIAATTSGLNTSDNLVNDMTGAGNLSSGSVGEMATFNHGVWNVSIPGYTDPQPLTRSEGVMVLNTGAKGTYTPSGTPDETAPTIQFNQGWNLIAPTWPNPGLQTDSMYNELQAQNGSCTSSNELPSCSRPVSDIAAMNGSGTYLDWRPAAPFDPNNTKCVGGNAKMGTPCWFQTEGNSIPFTYGLWVNANQPLTWTPDGIDCQAITKGMCS